MRDMYVCHIQNTNNKSPQYEGQVYVLHITNDKSMLRYKNDKNN